MTLKTGTLFGIVGAVIKIVAPLLSKLWYTFLAEAIYDNYWLYYPLDILGDILGDIFPYVAFAIFFVTLYKKQK